ncbi:uncharacterized protein LOC119285947 [Triticum dicoccoides]|uniref:uncharacterized protein LOC119285947 n=1 Tax=Triticum dicoccoides TaxID=85692 RepID=UPI00188FD5B1|nr:uncharacterized protein LOC119285947 [Triticum dicoccoides]
MVPRAASSRPSQLQPLFLLSLGFSLLLLLSHSLFSPWTTTAPCPPSQSASCSSASICQPRRRSSRIRRLLPACRRERRTTERNTLFLHSSNRPPRAASSNRVMRAASSRLGSHHGTLPAAPPLALELAASGHHFVGLVLLRLDPSDQPLPHASRAVGRRTREERPFGPRGWTTARRQCRARRRPSPSHPPPRWKGSR